MSGQTSGFIDMNSALADSQMISLERDMQRRFSPETFDPMGFTNYEIERESAMYGPPRNPTDPNQGEMGPPKPDYVLDRELFEEQRAGMPGSTADYHYDDQGNYLLGQVPEKKKREKTERTDEEKARRQRNREMGVNMFLGMGNNMLSALDEKRARERQDQIDAEIQRNRFITAPTDRGFTMTNLGVPVPPTKQTPVQFTGYNPSTYAKRGAEMKSDYMYLSPREIEEIIRLGGQVEFLD